MATPVKVDLKPVCKYGANCYRKSEQHLKQYRHPKRILEDESKQVKPKRKKEEPKKNTKRKGATIEDFFASKPKQLEQGTAIASSSFENSSKDTKEKSKQSSLLESEGQEDFSSEESETIQSVDSPADVHENIKSKFLVEMPEDFFDFWRFCKELNEEDPLDALQGELGLTLVGPFDILAGRHKDVERNSSGKRPNFLLHWRYYYDPPEFLTVIKGDDEKQFHLGYFRDDPSDMPVFVASNCAKDNGLITPRGENLFASVNYYLSERLKEKDVTPDSKKRLQKLQDALKAAAAKEGYSLDQKTKRMKDRDKKSVCKTFHGAGMVVPMDANGVGYRPVPESPADLKKILNRIHDSTTDEERDKNLEPLQEIITFIQFANDECDYGEGLELGLDLFTFGGKCFHSAIGSLLTLAYQLLGRPQFGKIIEAHLRKRSHSSDLSQID